MKFVAFVAKIADKVGDGSCWGKGEIGLISADRGWKLLVLRMELLVLRMGLGWDWDGIEDGIGSDKGKIQE